MRGQLLAAVTLTQGQTKGGDMRFRLSYDQLVDTDQLIDLAKAYDDADRAAYLCPREPYTKRAEAHWQRLVAAVRTTSHLRIGIAKQRCGSSNLQDILTTAETTP
jgi:hypothetical protein